MSFQTKSPARGRTPNRSRRRNETITPGKTPKFRSPEEQIKYFTRLQKKQQAEKAKKQ